jgi:hypothetical protein
MDDSSLASSLKKSVLSQAGKRLDSANRSVENAKLVATAKCPRNHYEGGTRSDYRWTKKRRKDNGLLA